jgi:hypothetical protein
MFAFRLEPQDGTPAHPATLQAAVPNWRPGDVITLGAGRRCASARFGTMTRTKRPCSSSRRQVLNGL